MEQPRQSLLGRLWADIRANPGVWIGVGITALVLVVGYLAYQNSQNSAAASGATGSSSTNGNSTNQPDWSSASLGTNPGDPSNAEIQAELDAIAEYIQNQQTPNPSGTAAPRPVNFHYPSRYAHGLPSPVKPPASGAGFTTATGGHMIIVNGRPVYIPPGGPVAAPTVTH